MEEQPVNKEVELSQEEVINFLRKYKEAGCKSVLHSILELFISEAKRNMFTELYKDENQKLSLEELPKIADTVTFKMLEEEAVQLEKKTVEQSKSTKWFEVRKGRITASILKEVCRTSSEKPAKSLIKKICNPQQLYSKEIIYGLKHESDALCAYLDAHKQRHTGVKLKKVCCIINCEYPQLNATPDSLV